jgi:hypothetical protein
MKSFRKELTFNIPTRRGFVNITPQVDQALRESGIREGLCLVNPMHITASIFVNDDESGLHGDYERWLEKIAPTSRWDSTNTIAPARTTRTPTSNAKSWAVRSWWRSPMAAWILARGSRSSTASLTGEDENAYC